ncbi:hypothetical protein ACQUY5_31465, partial [Bacillus cereus]
MSEKTCKAEGCTNKVLARDMCSKHYTQWRVHGELKPDLEKGKHNTCTVEYCNNTYYCKGYCIKHYR